MALGFMKQWKRFLKKKDLQVMEDVIQKLQEGLRAAKETWHLFAYLLSFRFSFAVSAFCEVLGL